MPATRKPCASLGAALWVAACAHRIPPEPAALPPPLPAACVADAQLSTPDHIAKHGSVLDGYHREGGVWLPHAPVLINRDFDFASAMSLDDGLGAGLAAAKRREGNEKRAAELAELKLPAASEAYLAELRCRGIRAYFLVWGEEKVAVQLVVDDAVDKTKSYVVERDTWEPASGQAVLTQRLSDALRTLEPEASTR